jgi:hypothetical protein
MAKEAGLGLRVRVLARPQWSLMKFRDKKGVERSLPKNVFQQEAFRRDLLLLGTRNLTNAHDTQAVHLTLEVYPKVLTLATWVANPDPSRFLEGPRSRPVFRVR